MSWYRVELRGRRGWVVAAVETDEEGTVVTAAPLLRWARGQPIEHVATWVEHRHGSIRRMPWEP